MLNKNNPIVIPAIVSMLVFASCNSNTPAENDRISTDTADITAGRKIFTKNCASCHEFKHDGIGPDLSGVTREVSAEWLIKFIKNPQEIISSGDKRADSLFKKFKSVMPPFSSFTDEEHEALLAFINTHKETLTDKIENEHKLTDPIPEKIGMSGLVADISPVTKFPSTSADNKPPLSRITKLGFEPGSGKRFVNDLRGKLYVLVNNTPQVYLDIVKLKPAFITEPGLATGFGSFAFHPGFLKNGLFYTTHTEAPETAKADFYFSDTIKTEEKIQWVLTEWKASNPTADTFSGSGRELLRINMVAGSHGVQEIVFNPLAKAGDEDFGKLYIGVGDGGSVQLGYPSVVQGKDKIWGSVIRIDPSGKNSANGKYGIPPDNPFTKANEEKLVKEVYAYGFRNPHRITWTKSGDMLVSNIGQANIESLYLVKKGKNYGWPMREGKFYIDPITSLDNIFPIPPNDSIYKITYPVATFDHDEGLAICGGYEYTGSALPALKGKFLFGDIPSGRLFYIEVADLKKDKPAVIKEWKITMNGAPKTLKEICTCDRVDLHFGRDANGELYILTKRDGMLYKITGAKTVTP